MRSRSKGDHHGFAILGTDGPPRTERPSGGGHSRPSKSSLSSEQAAKLCPVACFCTRLSWVNGDCLRVADCGDLTSRKGASALDTVTPRAKA